MRKIGICDLKIHAPVGLHDEEKTRGNFFLVDISVKLKEIPFNDDIGATLDYAELYRIAREKFRHPSNLIETVAEKIATEVKGRFPLAKSVKVKIRKLEPPGLEGLGASFFEIKI